jgi:hypothetical protein
MPRPRGIGLAIDLDHRSTRSHAVALLNVQNNSFGAACRRDGCHRERATARPTKRGAGRPTPGASKCDVCLVVASNQPYRPLLSHYAPSFYDVANLPETNAESLQTFLAHPHSYENMPSPDLTPAQVASLTAYILSLRGRH